MTDLELLRRYASSKSEDAFTELVRKYTGLVYAAALRQIVDARDAEEITQAVFVILAQKAAVIPNAAVLSAWLLRTTRYVAMNARRKRARRPQTELIDPDLHMTETDVAWKSIAPLLDESLLALSEGNRNVISLRFSKGGASRKSPALSVFPKTPRKSEFRGHWLSLGAVLGSAAWLCPQLWWSELSALTQFRPRQAM